jgi:hypothetical protein
MSTGRDLLKAILGHGTRGKERSKTTHEKEVMQTVLRQNRTVDKSYHSSTGRTLEHSKEFTSWHSLFSTASTCVEKETNVAVSQDRMLSPGMSNETPGGRCSVYHGLPLPGLINPSQPLPLVIEKKRWAIYKPGRGASGQLVLSADRCRGGNIGGGEDAEEEKVRRQGDGPACLGGTDI